MGNGGVSLKEVLHYAQLSAQTNNKFMKFNYYDAAMNQKKYGSTVVPEYNLGMVNLPIHLVVGKCDRLAPPAAIGLVSSQMPNARVTAQVVEQWGHAAFIMASNANEIYQALINDMKSL